MDVLAERTKQALHIGSKDFQPLSIERHEKMLDEVTEYARPLQSFEKSVRYYEEATKGFLQASSLFLLEAQLPRTYSAVGDVGAVLVEADTTPEQYRNLLAKPALDELRQSLHHQVAEKMHSDLALPVELWLKTYESIKGERMPRLQRLKIKADAARRKYEHRVLKHQEKSKKYSGESMTKAQKHAEKVQEYTEELDPSLTEFDAESSAVEQQLVWMVHQGGRLKALVADTLMWIRNTATAHTIPQGLLEHFPTHTLEAEGVRSRRLSDTAAEVEGEATMMPSQEGGVSPVQPGVSGPAMGTEPVAPAQQPSAMEAEAGGGLMPSGGPAGLAPSGGDVMPQGEHGMQGTGAEGMSGGLMPSGGPASGMQGMGAGGVSGGLMPSGGPASGMRQGAGEHGLTAGLAHQVADRTGAGGMGGAAAMEPGVLQHTGTPTETMASSTGQVSAAEDVRGTSTATGPGLFSGMKEAALDAAK